MDPTFSHVTWYRPVTPVPFSVEHRPGSDTELAPMPPAPPGPSQRSPAPTRPLDRRTVTVEEAAAILGIGRSAAYAAVKRGHIPALRLNRRLLVPLPALERLLNGEAPAPTGA